MTPEHQQAEREALKPCPFCGNEAEFKPYKRDGLTLKCATLGCVQFNQRTLRYSLDWLRGKMIEGWNRRAGERADVVPLSEEVIDEIANDGRRNAAGGIYATRVYEFARAIEAEHGIGIAASQDSAKGGKDA